MVEVLVGGLSVSPSELEVRSFGQTRVLSHRTLSLKRLKEQQLLHHQLMSKALEEVSNNFA